MAGKQKIKNRKDVVVFVFAATILFFLSLVLPAHAVEMGEIRSGEIKSGNIAIAGQTDSFTFHGKKDQGVVINMTEIGTFSMCPKISLYRPDGSRELIDSCFPRDSGKVGIENHQLEQTGKYTIDLSPN